MSFGDGNFNRCGSDGVDSEDVKFLGLCGFASVSSTMNHTMEIEIDAPIFIVFRMYMPRMNTPGERSVSQGS